MVLFGNLAHDGSLDFMTFYIKWHKAQTASPLCSRAEKESLETAVFESQELASSLEAKCIRTEGERRSLVLANEALTRE